MLPFSQKLVLLPHSNLQVFAGWDIKQVFIPMRNANITDWHKTIIWVEDQIGVSYLMSPGREKMILVITNADFSQLTRWNIKYMNIIMVNVCIGLFNHIVIRLFEVWIMNHMLARAEKHILVTKTDFCKVTQRNIHQVMTKI